MDRSKILLVDDDIHILRTISVNLMDSGFDVITSPDGQSALDILGKDTAITVVITDLAMEKMSGDELFHKINSLYPYIPVIILTAHGSVKSAVNLVRDGAFDYIEKPSDYKQLTKILNLAVKHNSLQQEINFLRQELGKEKSFHDIIGSSRKMLEIFERIKVAGPSDFNVLIEGESGTGKELIARAIYLNSHRKNQKFLPINCAAIPHALIESELMGHEAGAFTGAIGQKMGKFELANNGTVFLDEIGELDKQLQTKLLRVLDEKTFQRVGGNSNIITNFRLIAATNRDLNTEMKKNNFREDLFYRLNVINIHVPPLRSRREDIINLAEYFLKKYSILQNKTIKEIAPKALNVLYSYDWPGNVRELENIIKRTIVFCKTNKINISDLPQNIVSYTQINMDKKLQKKVINESEKKEILKALKVAGGNKAKAARIMDVSRPCLYRKIAEYDIDS